MCALRHGALRHSALARRSVSSVGCAGVSNWLRFKLVLFILLEKEHPTCLIFDLLKLSLPRDPKTAFMLVDEEFENIAKRSQLRADSVEDLFVQPPATGGASKDSWVTTFAMLLLSGVGIEMCAERLGKPRNVLSSLLNQGSFQTMLQSMAKETGKDAATSLLRSTAVDSVLAIVKLRDNSQSDSIKLNAAKTLMTWNFFHNRSDKLPTDPNAVHDALRRSGLELTDAIDKEIERLVQGSPVLKSNPLLASLVDKPEDLRAGVLPEGAGGRKPRALGNVEKPTA